MSQNSISSKLLRKRLGGRPPNVDTGHFRKSQATDSFLLCFPKWVGAWPPTCVCGDVGRARVGQGRLQRWDACADRPGSGRRRRRSEASRGTPGRSLPRGGGGCQGRMRSAHPVRGRGKGLWERPRGARALNHGESSLPADTPSGPIRAAEEATPRSPHTGPAAASLHSAPPRPHPADPPAHSPL